MKDVLLVVLGGAIAAIAGLISQLFTQSNHRKNRRLEIRREKAESLANALVDVKHAAESICAAGGDYRIDHALLDNTSVRKVEMLTALYFPDIDVTSFFVASRILVESAKRVERDEGNSDDDWPRFTSAAAEFDSEADRLLKRLSAIVHEELGQEVSGAA